MRTFLAIILITILSAAAEYFLPWWIIAVICFAVTLLLQLKPGRGFAVGFCGVALCWLIVALMHDISNAHLLSRKMAMLFHLPGYGLFIIVSAIIGGLVGGMAGWAGALAAMRDKKRRRRIYFL